MKWYIASLSALCLAIALGSTSTVGQSRDSVAAHEAASKAAAGQEWPGLYTQLCTPADRATNPPRGRGAATPRGAGAGRGAAAPNIPDRAQWHHEPAKIFDNLDFVGVNDVASWAVTTSQGIILIDALNDYAVEDEVVGGLKKLGLDPKQIKYVIVSHGHVTHFGGAKFLQDTYGARVRLAATDWDLIEGTQGAQPKPKRDMVITDGQKLTLGDTTITMYLTPGHTPGAISYLIPVKDKGQPHVVALSGISSATGAENLKTHIASAARFADIVGKANADVMISDEDHFANYIKKIDTMTASHSGPDAFIVGNGAVKRYLTVVGECSAAVLASLQ